MRRAAIDPVPGGEIFEFKYPNGELVPPQDLFTTHGDILLEHVIKTITYQQLGTILSYNQLAAQWIQAKRVWMRLFKRDFPHTFYLVHEPGTPTQMKEYYRNMLDKTSKRAQNIHTYYKRYYELHVQLKRHENEPPLFKVNYIFRQHFIHANNVRGFYIDRPEGKLQQDLIGTLVIDSVVNDQPVTSPIRMYLGIGNIVALRKRKWEKRTKNDWFLKIEPGESFIVPGTTIVCFVFEDAISIVQPILTSPLVSCRICDSTTNLQQCAQCGEAAYCSAECQEQDWEEHSKTCQ